MKWYDGSWEDIQAAAIGRTITSVRSRVYVAEAKERRWVPGLAKGCDEVCFDFGDEEALRFFHEPDCCESVTLEDFELQGEALGKILSLDEVANADGPDPGGESHTWTFYHLRTERGVLTMRWLGESNGYYSEEVSVRCGAWE